MEFKKFKQNLADHLNTITAKYPLYETDVDKDHLWNLYLDSFPEGTNPIFRERRTYDCNYCRQFIKNIGGTVYIDENLEVHSIFEFDAGSITFQTVADALSTYVKSCPITDIYLNWSANVGMDENRELLDGGSVITWNHLYAKLPSNLVAPMDKIPTNKARVRDRINVFERCLKEISMDAIDTILELISANTLYKGEEWKNHIQKLRDFKATYIDIPDDKKHAYALRTGFGIDDVIGKIRNHSIGVLLIDISEGMDLDAAVRRYEQIVAPTNYKRPKAIYTKKMLEDAQKTVTELGYMDSLQRRYATLDDITVNNILFSNRDAAKRISGNVFDEMISEAGVNPKKFSRVEEVSAEKFVKDILPSAKSLEVLLENSIRNALFLRYLSFRYRD